MNNSFSLQHISRTGNLDSYLISRQNQRKLKAKLMQIQFENQKLKQSEIAKESGCSSSTLQNIETV